MENIFDRWNENIRGVESSFVNFVSAVAPWLAPLAPAFMTYQHAEQRLDFPWWISIPSALVVEILGFSAVSTLMSFSFFNRKNRAQGKQAPVKVVVFAFSFYLLLILSSNVLLDATKEEWALITVRALFTLQTIPAALIVVARAGHRDLIAQIEKEKKQANEPTNSSANGSQGTNGSANSSANGSQTANKPRTFASLTAGERNWLANADTNDAAAKFGVTPRAIQKWKLKV
jgi:hypothetical protein